MRHVKAIHLSHQSYSLDYLVTYLRKSLQRVGAAVFHWHAQQYYDESPISDFNYRSLPIIHVYINYLTIGLCKYNGIPSSGSSHRLSSLFPPSLIISIQLTLKVLNFWKFTSYCSLKPLWSGMGEAVPARTSPTLHPLLLCTNCRD